MALAQPTMGAPGHPFLYNPAQQLLMSQSGVQSMMLTHTSPFQEPPPLLPPQSLQGQHLMAQAPPTSASSFGAGQPGTGQKMQWSTESKSTSFGDIDIDHRNRGYVT